MDEETIGVIDTPEETPEVEAVDTPTLEDYNRLQKENQTLKAQKEHFRKKASQPKEELIKTTQTGITREEAILFAKGLTEEEIELASKIAKVNGVPLIKATEDEYFQAKVESRQREERSNKAQLGASTGSGGFKDVSQMSGAEHEEYARRVMAGL